MSVSDLVPANPQGQPFMPEDSELVSAAATLDRRPQLQRDDLPDQKLKSAPSAPRR